MKMHNSPDVWTLIVTWVAEHKGEPLIQQYVKAGGTLA